MTSKISTKRVRRPAPKVADLGTVRVGDAMITAKLPLVRRADKKTADPGIVRVGDAMITARLPSGE